MEWGFYGRESERTGSAELAKRHSFIYNETMHPRETLQRFDAFLALRGASLDAILVGGAALDLLGVISRETRDCDVIHPDLSKSILDAAQAFAQVESRAGWPLAPDWLNNGPASLTRALPVGWQTRIQTVFTGAALTLHTLGRRELLFTKVFALCDRGTDLKDCLALCPTGPELMELTPWVQEQDANPQWPEHVDATLRDLARRLGHGV